MVSKAGFHAVGRGRSDAAIFRSGDRVPALGTVRASGSAFSGVFEAHGPVLVSLEGESSEAEVGPDPGATSPDAAFEAHWRDAVMASAFEALRREAHQRDETVRFQVLAPLLGGVDKADMDVAAHGLGVTRNHANQLLYRLRLRYRELILVEISRTLPVGSDPAIELQNLMGDASPRRSGS